MNARRNKIWALMVMGVFILPNAYVVVTASEDFPFTCAPMFGHYIGQDTYLYKFRFIGMATGAERELMPYYPKTPAFHAIRLFFRKAYGSMEPDSPFGNHEGDSRAAFEQRVSRYFFVLFDEINHPEMARVQTIRFEIDQYNRNKIRLATHVIGHYDVSTKTFTHTWSTHP